MTEERRQGLNEVNDRLIHVETSIAVIESRIIDTQGLKKLVVGQIVFLTITLVGVGIAWGELRQKVSSFNLDMVEKNTAIAISVAEQHGEEILLIRQDDAMIKGEVLQMRKDIAEMHKEMRSRTDDRYRRSDAISSWEAQKAWLLERFKNLDQRIGHLESEHHRARNKSRGP